MEKIQKLGECLYFYILFQYNEAVNQPQDMCEKRPEGCGITIKDKSDGKIQS